MESSLYFELLEITEKQDKIIAKQKKINVQDANKCWTRGWGHTRREEGIVMAKFYMFYGVQVYEFERPAIVAKPGKAKIKPTTTKVVMKNDLHNQAK